MSNSIHLPQLSLLTGFLEYPDYSLRVNQNGDVTGYRVSENDLNPIDISFPSIKKINSIDMRGTFKSSVL